MFGFLYELMGGAHETLPARRRTAPSVSFDPVAGAFVSVDGDPLEDVPWPGRGDVPGQLAREPQTAAAGELTLAEEMQRLVAERATPAGAAKRSD